MHPSQWSSCRILAKWGIPSRSIIFGWSTRMYSTVNHKYLLVQNFDKPVFPQTQKSNRMGVALVKEI